MIFRVFLQYGISGWVGLALPAALLPVRRYNQTAGRANSHAAPSAWHNSQYTEMDNDIMKAVPVNHDGDFGKSRLLFPSGVCVGCARKTDKMIEERNWGYSNTYFKFVSFQMCESCVQIEHERKKLEKEIALVELKNNQLFLIPGVAVGALLGLCLPFVLLQWFGWGVVIAVAAVGLILGAIGGLVIGGLVARQCDDRTRKAIYNKWASVHPNWPDPSKEAIYFSKIYYGPKLEKGRRYAVDGLYCQCDAYGEALLRVPYYSAVNEMVEGEISFPQLVEKVKDI